MTKFKEISNHDFRDFLSKLVSDYRSGKLPTSKATHNFKVEKIDFRIEADGILSSAFKCSDVELSIEVSYDLMQFSINYPNRGNPSTRIIVPRYNILSPSNDIYKISFKDLEIVLRF
ncbi:hypothetical protein J4230_00685 [Candidatus Woesearchaeota archaeon]|nr:hypothetical protein [Candidatus Woesearchaeota archaeon]